MVLSTLAREDTRSNVQCGVCGGHTQLEIAAPATTYAPHGRYAIATCVDCGCGCTSPTPTSAELEAQYTKIYKYDTHALIAPEKRWRAARILDAALRPEDHSVLDVGTMFGFLLEEAKARGIQRCVGVEPSESPSADARQRGLDVFTGSVEAFAAARQGETFDLVIVQHVLEHVPRLDEFLQALRGLLTERGRLCVCVPNFDSRTRHTFKRSWGWYQVPVHVHHFGDKALRRTLHDAGFRVESSHTQGGDSLFVMMTILQSLGRAVSSSDANEPGAAVKAIVRTASTVLRPYYYVGDDELMMIAAR